MVDGMLVDWGVSIRQACGALGFDPSSYHYKSRRTGQAAMELRVREICETRVRYGYRRIMSCCDGRGGRTTRRRAGFTMSWVRNSETRIRSGG